MSGVNVFPVPLSSPVPSANTAANVLSIDVVGNKTDTAVTTVGTTASISAYVKGLQLSTTQESGVTSLTPGTSGAYSAFTEIIASLGSISLMNTFSASIDSSAAGGLVTIFVAKGAGGSEVEIATYVLGVTTNAIFADRASMSEAIFEQLPSGTRISVKAKTSAANVGTLSVAFNAYKR